MHMFSIKSFSDPSTKEPGCGCGLQLSDPSTRNLNCLQARHVLCLQSRHLLCLQPRHLLCQQKTSVGLPRHPNGVAKTAAARPCRNGIAMSWETTDVLPADTKYVLAADATDVVSADAADVLSADANADTSTHPSADASATINVDRVR